MSSIKSSASDNTDDRSMTIGDLSDISGLSTSAIRFYQRRGLLPARDVEGGWQRYGTEALSRLAVIELAKSAGFSLDEIVRFLDALNADPDSVPESTPIWHGLAEFKLAEVERRIERLRQMRQLLQDSLDCSYVSADRARQVPVALGWVEANGDAHHALPGEVAIPTSTRELDAIADSPARDGVARDELTTR